MCECRGIAVPCRLHQHASTPENDVSREEVLTTRRRDCKRQMTRTVPRRVEYRYFDLSEHQPVAAGDWLDVRNGTQDEIGRIDARLAGSRDRGPLLVP